MSSRVDKYADFGTEESTLRRTVCGSCFALVGTENSPRRGRQLALSPEKMTRTTALHSIMNNAHSTPFTPPLGTEQRIPILRVRPVSPQLATDKSSSSNRTQSRRRLRSLSASNLTSPADSDPQDVNRSRLIERRTVSLKTLLINPSQTVPWDSRTEYIELPVSSKVLASPCTSPSSGYNSGLGCNSPGCNSPTRCSSPVLTMEEPRKERAKDLLKVPSGGPGRPRRTSSHDSGVVGLSVSSPSSLDNSSNEDISFQDVTSYSKEADLSSPSSVFKRPPLQRHQAVHRLNDAASEEMNHSPDEGFQDFLRPPREPLPGRPLSPCEFQRNQMSVRLKQPTKSPTFQSLVSKFERFTSLDAPSTRTPPQLDRMMSEPLAPSIMLSPPTLVVPDGDIAVVPDEDTVLDSHESMGSATVELPTLPTVVISEHDENANGTTRTEGGSRTNGDQTDSMSSSSMLDILSSSAKMKLERKSSSSSTLSNLDSEPDSSEEQPKEISRSSVSWSKIRKVVHWSPFIQSYKKKYPWVQIAGHQGSFKAGENGTILKKYCEKEETALQVLMTDVLRPYIPEYKGVVTKDADKFVRMQDLLEDFDNPSVMDCKMGTRTYLEEELKKAKEKTKLRPDLFQKMISIDMSAPTDVEAEQKAITKPRYMQWREHVSSSATLGFRIEGIKKGEGHSNKKYYKIRERSEVSDCFNSFIDSHLGIRDKYVKKLTIIKATLETSQFFRSHEVIGSSLLFVHDKSGRAEVWMIDFGKTTPLPGSQKNNHRDPWREGVNLEDGYLFGLDNMIEVWKDLEPTPGPIS